MSDQYEWDPAKASLNFRNHGITFEEATEALTDPDCVIIYDELHSSSEHRFHSIGLSSKGVLLVVSTDRDKGTICRIISARRATRREQTIYEKTKN